MKANFGEFVNNKNEKRAESIQLLFIFVFEILDKYEISYSIFNK